MVSREKINKNINPVSPKSLINSKWTKITVLNKEKHFIVSEVEFNEDKKIVRCVMQAVINHAEYDINWRSLKDGKQWLIGWK
ncbi:MAG: tryptophan-rich hypothetical protein [Psychromonas sp.]|jgi:tryptophan-rich hypothetical protein